MDAKSALKSKTLWFNLAAGIIGLAQQQGLFSLVPEPYGPAVLVFGNLLLRFFTTQPVALTAKP